MRYALLTLLAERAMHGYELIQELERRSEGRWRPSPGSVYPTLQLLEDEGLVKGEERDGRRVFEMTPAGHSALAERSTSEGPPWDLGEGDEAHLVLRGAAFQLTAAVMQVAGAGSPAQIEQTRTILDEARKKIYGILAES